MKISFTLTANGVETDVTPDTAVVYTNGTDAPRVIPSEKFNFRNARLLIFNRNGKLIEAGGELLANADGTFGSPQTSVAIPAGGFLVGFGWHADARLHACYSTAFEGAMLYNATMAILYDVNGAFDPATKQLSISYASSEPVPANAVKFLFVGNSSTYFNGTPIQFKGLCRAAGVPVTVTYCTFGSAYLHEFADPAHERGKAYREKLNAGRYDYVVFQDAGGASEEDSKAALEVLVPLCVANGAAPLLYMRYPSGSTADARLSGAVVHENVYTALAKTYNTVAAPAAVAFCRCFRERPEIDLYADDRSHHSAAGSYLIACTWLRSFLGVSPAGNAYKANLDAGTAAALQEIALRACDGKG